MVVGEAKDGRGAVKMVSELQPQVVVMDLHMPDLNGIEAARQVRAASPRVKVIGLSASSDEHSAHEMLDAGAAGYVGKASAFEDLVAAIRTVMSNKVYISEGVARAHPRAAAAGGVTSTESAFAPALSAREREVLQLLASGKATKEVAAVLHISVKTAETHRRNLMEKLQIDNVAELTKYAICEGIIAL